MGYRIARGDTIALAWQVRAGDPSTVSSTTAALRPALAGDPATVDAARVKVADFSVAERPEHTVATSVFCFLARPRPPGRGVRVYVVLAAAPYQPTFCPLFCSSNHFWSGAKYSRMALPST